MPGEQFWSEPTGWHWAGWLAIAVATLLTLTYVPAMVLKWRQRRDLLRRCRGKLVLTYDDGPDPLLTPKLLELLERHHVKASFFLLGFRAQRSPQVGDLLARSGNELGCHAQWHLNSWRIPPWRAIRNINEGYRSIASWAGADAPFRPPYGKLTSWPWLSLWWRGAPVRWWTADGCDTHPQLPDPARVSREIMERGGAVVLLHNHDRGEERQRYVLAVTEQLLIAAKRQGLEICTMGDLYSNRQP